MNETKNNLTPSPVAKAEYGVKYITDALINEKLQMATACKELGWSFPRIRSRALTVAKKMNCAIVKVSRGVYILEPLKKSGSTNLEDGPKLVEDDEGAVNNLTENSEQ